ncbi:Xaa-Pro dipeptidase [Schumannella luteola]|uniref:Xaa-Pro dipeptidase n=1 Tax=Schumannella luteola TaxID=472059 RepID=A0A852YAG3_9MICO|nr:Xaa-Pro peptidase family protein [Schumannella luteola]NYG98350.1 Xaa-Pro dipeptidase [Schumannella luteola]
MSAIQARDGAQLGPSRYADVERIRRLIAASDFDVIVSTWPENTHYLSGFYHPDMRLTWERLHIVVWPSGGDPVYVVPAARADNWNGVATDTWAPEETRPFITDIRGYRGEHEHMVEVVADVLRERGLTRARIGVEYRATPVKVTEGLRHLLPETSTGDAWPLLNAIRAVKTPAEVERLTHVNRLTALHLGDGLRSIRPGDTERQVASRITDALFRDGAAELTHSVFGGGCRAGQWHPWPSDSVLEEGMLIRSDWGVRIDGYCSDIARTAVVGRATRAQRTRFDRISAVHDVIVDSLRPGVVASELVDLARREYERLGEEFRWGIVGHGIGLVLHEEPQLTVEYDEPLVEGMTLQIELGWVDPVQGYHIEDLIHLGRDGATNLTTAPGTRTLIETGD